MFNAEHYRKTNSDRIVVSDNLLTSCGVLMRSQRANGDCEAAAAATAVRVADRPGAAHRLRVTSTVPARPPACLRPRRLLLLPRTSSFTAVYTLLLLLLMPPPSYTNDTITGAEVNPNIFPEVCMRRQNVSIFATLVS